MTQQDSVRLDVGKLREFADLDNEIKQLEDRVKELKGERRQREMDLLEELGAAGISTIPMDDGRTIYRAATIWASIPAEKRQDAIARFEQLGLGDLVTHTFNASTLSAKVREWLDPEAGPGVIPSLVEDLIETREVTQLRVVRGRR